MTETITKPTRKQLTALFAAARDAADAGGRARTLVRFDPAELADRVMKRKAGLYEQDGGGVANSYGYRAESSAIGVVWYTRPDRVKVVRVSAARVGCSGRHVSSMNLGARAQQEKLAAAGLHAVLAHRELMAVWGDSIPGAEPFVKAIKKEFGAVTPWLVLADWLDERNQPGNAMFFRPSDTEIAAAIRAAFAAPAVTV